MLVRMEISSVGLPTFDAENIADHYSGGLFHGRGAPCAADIRPAVRGVMRERGVKRSARASKFCTLVAVAQSGTVLGSAKRRSIGARPSRHQRLNGQSRKIFIHPFRSTIYVLNDHDSGL